MDLNHGPLVSEATALSTEPQPLPKEDDIFCLVFFYQLHVVHGQVMCCEDVYTKIMLLESVSVLQS